MWDSNINKYPLPLHTQTHRHTQTHTQREDAQFLKGQTSPLEEDTAKYIHISASVGIPPGCLSLSVCQPVHLSVCLSFCLSTYLHQQIYINVSGMAWGTNHHIYLFIYLFIFHWYPKYFSPQFFFNEMLRIIAIMLHHHSGGHDQLWESPPLALLLELCVQTGQP